MSKDEFREKVLGQLHTDSPYWEPSLDLIRDEIDRFFEKGWNMNEVVSFLRNSEEFDPSLDEDTALRNMKRITERANKRLAGG